MENVKNRSFVTVRSIIFGLIVIIINSHWQTGASSTLDIEITDLSIFSNVIFFLFIITLLNQALSKVALKKALSHSELLTIYVMLATSTALNGTDMIKCLVSLVSNGIWYATPENEWDNLFGPYLPKWLIITNKHILRGYYEGHSSLYNSEYIKAWLPKALAWSGFATVLIFVMICINILLRRQWVRNERLTYPIIQLPLEMTRTNEGRGLFRNKLLWIGFAVAGFVSFVNQMHIWLPIVPSIPVQPVSLTQYFTTKPWNAVSNLNRTFYPFAIGIGYLMPLDLIVSTWFFHLFWQAERIAGSAMGVSYLPGFPYEESQVTGAWIALLVFSIWIGRKHFSDVIKKIFTRSKPDDEGLISYRTATLGIITGTAFLIMFCYYMGMSIWLMTLFFIIYFALSTTITRVRAELGPPIHTMHGSTPDEILITFLGTRRIGPQNLTGFGMLHWITGYSNRENPMPIQLEAFKLAERTNTNPSLIPIAIVLSALIGSIAGFWAFLHDGYRVGVESYPERTWAASVGFDVLESRIQNPTSFQPISVVFTVIGFAFTTFMLMMRTRFLWWTLHPVGYAVSGEWGIGRIWIPLIIASTCKWAVLRFYGLKGYRQSVPFFFGLILGDFVLGCIWATIGIVFNTRVYVYWTG